MTMKGAAWIAGSVLFALGAGWVWGASGRAAAVTALRAAQVRADLSEARALVLDGRISLFQHNFGDAGARFHDAAALVQRVQARLREGGQAERAGRLEIALSHLANAVRLAAAVDPAAQDAAASAADALVAVATSPPSP
jgi:hypothetical protein